MYGPLITALIREHESRHEGPVPPVPELVWLPWVAPFLRILAPSLDGQDAGHSQEIVRHARAD